MNNNWFCGAWFYPARSVPFQNVSAQGTRPFIHFTDPDRFGTVFDLTTTSKIIASFCEHNARSQNSIIYLCYLMWRRHVDRA